MASVQLTCARIGMVSGMGLASVLRRHYARNLLYLTYLGSSSPTHQCWSGHRSHRCGDQLLVPIPITVLVLPIALVILALQIWGSYRLIAKTFKWLTLALFAYIGSALFSKPDAIQVLKATFIPTLRFDATSWRRWWRSWALPSRLIFFFWQADQEVEEEISFRSRDQKPARGATDAE